MEIIVKSEINNVFGSEGVQFDKWANIQGLNKEEKYLVDKYLSSDLEASTIEAGTG